jgi:large conductance mechanosensitive channel
MKNFLKEFRDFAMKGNVLDLAIGVVIGAAFGKIVTSLVSDVLMPIIGILLGQLDFSALSLTVGESTVRYGLFLQSVIDFIIVAFCIFILIKQVNRFHKKKQEEALGEPAEEIQLLQEIRDLLRK